MGNTLQNKVIYKFHEKIVFDFLKKIRNYLVANPIIRIDQRNREESEEEMIRKLSSNHLDKPYRPNAVKLVRIILRMATLFRDRRLVIIVETTLYQPEYRARNTQPRISNRDKDKGCRYQKLFGQR